MARSKSGYITYEFEELAPFPGYECIVWGEAQIYYEWDSDDYEVGYRGGFGISVESIKIYSSDKDNPSLDLITVDHLLHDRILNVLLSTKYEQSIIYKIEDTLV